MRMIDIVISPKNRKLYDTCMILEKNKWQDLGVDVELNIIGRSWRFTDAQIVEGLAYLGIYFDDIPKQKKWFEFWKDDFKLRTQKAIDMIELDRNYFDL